MIQMMKLCAYDDDLKYELDELIEEFTRNNDRIWACRGILNRVSIYMNIITYQKLCREIGYKHPECARYREFSIKIDNYLKNGQFMMKEDDRNMGYLFKPYDGNEELELRNEPLSLRADKIICGRRSGKTLATFNPVPLRYIINKGATILFWADGDKTIVKRSKDDKFDKVKGFLWAYFLKHSGMSRSKANKYLEKLEVEDK